MYELTSNFFICLIKVLTIDVDTDRSTNVGVFIYNKNRETWHEKKSSHDGYTASWTYSRHEK